jgi:hypothetical protein
MVYLDLLHALVIFLPIQTNSNVVVDS